MHNGICDRGSVRIFCRYLFVAGARYSVVANERHPVVAGTPYGAGYSRCSFKELTNPGGVVRLIAHWQPL